MACKTCHFDPCRCSDLAAGYMGRSMTPTCWPMKSVALCVHPKQALQANERAKRHGINVYYNRQGTCIIPDSKNYAKLLRIEGLHSKSEGYHGS